MSFDGQEFQGRECYFEAPGPSSDDATVSYSQFRCSAGGRYEIPDDYKETYWYVDEYGRSQNQACVNVQKIYEDPLRFMQDCSKKGIMQSFRPHSVLPSSFCDVDPSSQLPSHEIVEIEDVIPGRGGRLWVSAWNEGTVRRMLCQPTKDFRVIFTPSYKRNEIALLKCEDLGYALTVVVIDHDQLSDYVYALNTENTEILTLPTSARGIGATRNWILTTAMYWGLETCWMIDDNVAIPSLKRYFHYEYENKIRQGYHSRPTTFPRACDFLEHVMYEKGLCLLAPATEHSVTTLAPHRSLDVVTHRAPTSFILLNVALLRQYQIQYVDCLTQKEDIILAYMCQKKRLRTGVDRGITFKKLPRSFGSEASGAAASGRDCALYMNISQKDEFQVCNVEGVPNCWC